MSSEPQNQGRAISSPKGPLQQQKRDAGASNGARRKDDFSLSNDEIEQVIRCMEKEYGSEMSDAMRKAMRDEISTAVPKLTKALVPIVTSAAQNSGPTAQSQEELVRAFMQIMLPHMRRIVNVATNY